MSTQAIGEVAEVVTDRVYALGGWERLDSRRMHWAPEGVDGWQPYGAYLLQSDEGAALVHTGPRIHGEIVERQLADLLPAGSPLWLVLPRADLMTTGNLEALSQSYELQGIYGGGYASNYLDGLDFVNGLYGTDLPISRTAPGETLEVAGFRFEPIRGTIKQTTTFWMYETETRGFFAAELFCHTHRPDPSHSRIVSDVDDVPLAEVEAFMLRKFPWIEQAHSAPLQQQMREVFASLDVEYIAPEVGCVLTNAAIADSVQALIGVMERNEIK